MKKVYLFIGFALVYSFLAIAMNNKISKEKLEGKWNVKVADAPDGYQDFILDIKEDRGEYRADIHFVGSNRRIPNRELTLKDGKLTGSLVIDGERIDVTIWEEKGIVQGTAVSDWLGTVKVTLTRPKD